MHSLHDLDLPPLPGQQRKQGPLEIEKMKYYSTVLYGRRLHSSDATEGCFIITHRKIHSQNKPQLYALLHQPGLEGQNEKAHQCLELRCKRVEEGVLRSHTHAEDQNNSRSRCQVLEVTDPHADGPCVEFDNMEPVQIADRAMAVQFWWHQEGLIKQGDMYDWTIQH